MLTGLVSLFCVAFVLRSCQASSSPSSYIFTSAQIVPGARPTSVANDNYYYYVYAAYSPSAANADYYKNVFINYKNGNVVLGGSVFELGNSKDSKGALKPVTLNGKYGIQVVDKNFNNGGLPMPYVIYIVDGNNDKAEIYESSKTSYIDSGSGIFSAEVTVLNPMPVMTLTDFDIRSGAELEAFTAPYDNRKDATRVFHITKKEYAPRSVLVVTGPIVTVQNSGVGKNGFYFKVNTNQVFNRTMPKGSVYSVSSPGYEMDDSQYSHPYSWFYPLSQEITYDGTTKVTVRVHGSFSSSAQLAVYVDGETTTYTKARTDDKWTSSKSATKVDMVIKNGQYPPNFYVEITSGSRLMSLSLLISFFILLVR